MKHKLLLVLLFLSTMVGVGQTPIQGEFGALTLPEFRKKLQKEYGIELFYDPVWGDSLSLKGEESFSSLEGFLSAFCNQNGLSFFQQGKDVIFTQGQALNPKLPQGFWESPIPQESERTGEFSYLNAESPKESILANPENQVYSIGSFSASTAPSVAGYVRDSRTGEALVGASVFIQSPPTGTLTDNFGYYVLNLPRGAHELIYTYVGKKEARRNIDLQGEGQLDVELEEEILSLGEVVISGEKSQIESVQTGAVKLNLGEINTIPTVLGEADIMKISLNLPGVQTVGEGASGFHVRGGTNDQNLILLNGISVYNPNHLFGFFSAFNPNVIKYAELFKSGIKAQYGGRASSVFDIAIREGNRNKLIAKGGISPITGKVSLEGPIPGNKGSFIVGLRSTYANWLLEALEDPRLRNSKAYFGDVIGNLTLPLNEKNNISISGYYSRDRFRLDNDTLYRYANANASLKWRRSFSNTFSGLLTLGYTHYSFSMDSERTPSNAFSLDYGINQSQAKLDFDWYPSSKHHLQFGLQSSLYDLKPGELLPTQELSGIRPQILNSERGIESAVYVGDEFTLSSRLSIYTGIRLTHFTMLGPGEVFLYAPDVPRESSFIVDTLSFASGQNIKTYWGPELHFTSRYKLSSQLSAKVSIDRSQQFVHMLTNTIAVSPTDSWRLSNTYLSPQISDQVALGLYKEFTESGLEVSLEGYFKNLQNILEYKDGADLLVNETLEADVVGAEGRAFGIEFLLKKKTGQLNGWISYTFSRTRLRADSPFPEERINEGDWYSANYDIPHNVAVISNYKVNRRVNFSLNLAYRTGRPTTVPITQYQFRGNQLAYFSQRNEFRVPDYFRADVAINIEGNHKVDKLGHSSWSFSIYNLTGRNNAYSVFSRFQEGRVQTFQLSVFARPVLSLTYNFELR
ncbi:MAG: TonB-dependent receptor [Bacteroidota bacterium]